MLDVGERQRKRKKKRKERKKGPKGVQASRQFDVISKTSD